MKKFLSLVLALIMTMSLVTIGAGAKEFTDDEKITYDEAVNVISTIGVVDGYEDGSFNPQGALTRGAAAKIICNMILGPTTAAELRADTAPFKDVPTNHTFAGYIAYCAKEGIISGYADGSFRPSGTLTGYAFMKMLLGALGYDANREGYVGANWSINVAKQALNIGLNASLQEDFNGVKAVNREEACLYAFNTLKADLVEYETIVSTTINGQNVNIGNSIAKAQTWQNSATRKTNIKNDNYIQFAEQYFTKLVLTEDVDVFGRPDREWEFEGKDIGTYVNYDLLEAEYTEKVTGLDLYNLLGKSTIEDYTTTVYIDGITDKKIDDSIFTAADMNKNNKEKVGATGDGVLTQVFVDSDSKEITVAIINTYLAIASSDYNTKKEAVTFDVYALEKVSDEYVKNTDKKVSLTASIDDFAVEDVKEDDAYLVNVADGEIQILQQAEVVEDTEISSFKIGSDVTADGTKYSYADTAMYDEEVLDNYTGTGDGTVNLKDLTYNVYLDQYGFLIGVDLVEEADNYVFITGVDSSYSNLYTKNVDAAGIFIDGTMDTIRVNTTKSTGLQAGPTVNRWYTYTVSNDGVYTLKEIKSLNDSANNTPKSDANPSKLAQYADEHRTTVIDKKNVWLPGGGTGEYAKVYGNDKTVYLTASIKEIVTDTNRTDIIIDEVDGVTVGIKNANIDVWADTSDDVLKVENTLGLNSKTQSAGVYTLYKNNGYVIATVVVGEDAAATKNLVYAHTSKVELESYEKTDDEWTWLRKVTSQGEEVTIKEVGDALTYLNQMEQYHWYQVKFNANDEVISVEPVTKLGQYEYVSDIKDLDKAEDEEDTVLYSQSFEDDRPSMKSNTLFVNSTEEDNNGFHVAEDVKVLLIQTNKNTETTDFFTGSDQLEDEINNLNEKRKNTYDYQISAIIEGGDATVVVIWDKTNNYNRPADATSGGVTATARVNAFGRVTVSLSVVRPAYVPTTASVNVAYDVYVNGIYAGSSTAIIDSKRNSVADSSAGIYADDEDDDVTVDVTNVTYSEVYVKYVNGDTNKALDVKDGATETVKSTGNNTITFSLNTTSTTPTLKYTLTGLVDGQNVEDETAFKDNDNAPKTWNNKTAEGDDYVTVTVYGLSKIVDKYSITGLGTSIALKDCRGGDKATSSDENAAFTITAGKTTGIEAGTDVEFTLALGTATVDAAYQVSIPKLSKNFAFVLGKTNAWDNTKEIIEVNGDIDIDPAKDIVVSKLAPVTISKVDWTDKTVTIIFSGNVKNGAGNGIVEESATGFEDTDARIDPDSVSSSGNILTFRVINGKLEAGDQLEIDATKLTDAYGITVDTDGKTTIELTADGFKLV